MIPKIADRHLSRQACIPIRQSTLAQVRFNQESTDRQYNLINLMNKARSLGWSQEQIRVLDRDLGKSGATASTRTDFKTLFGDVAMGHVGAIFSMEASRLAHSNQDWHRLLELCAITGTIVIDEDGVYDPADFNDGLVLCMAALLPLQGINQAQRRIVIDAFTLLSAGRIERHLARDDIGNLMRACSRTSRAWLKRTSETPAALAALD